MFFLCSKNVRVHDGLITIPKEILGLEARAMLLKRDLFCEIRYGIDFGTICLLAYPEENPPAAPTTYRTLSRDRTLNLESFLNWISNPAEVLILGLGSMIGIYEAKEGLKILERKREDSIAKLKAGTHILDAQYHLVRKVA